jgi:hypothetical protein
MMLEQSMQLRLQQYTDCFAETDPSIELREISRKGVEGDLTGDVTEVALKYLSLALLSAIEEGASDIVFSARGDLNGSCHLRGDRKIRLPSPPSGLTRQMIRILRDVSGLESDRGSSRLVWGLRNDQLELRLQAERDGPDETLNLTLPWRKRDQPATSGGRTRTTRRKA